MSVARRAFAVVAALTLWQAVALARDPYAEFRVPDHRSFAWTLDASGFARSRESRLESRFRSQFVEAGLLSDLSWLSESESRLHAVTVVARVDGDREHDRVDGETPFVWNDSHSRNVDADAVIDLDERRYLGESAWAADLQASGRALSMESHFAGQSRFAAGVSDQHAVASGLFRVRDQTGTVEAGLGIGHPRDVTGVYGAQVIASRLAAMGLLAHPLSAAASGRLARLLTVAGDFAAAHERPARYFWREVERVLREDGALAEGALDAYSTLRLVEPAFGRRAVRTVPRPRSGARTAPVHAAAVKASAMSHRGV